MHTFQPHSPYTITEPVFPLIPDTMRFYIVNDPAPIPSRHPSEGSYHWTFDRLLTVGLVPLTIAPLSGASLSPVMDSVLCGVLVLHCHTGFQSIITDYVPPRRLPNMAWLFKWGLRAATLTTAFGLYEFETNDVGLTEGIKRIWKA